MDAKTLYKHYSGAMRRYRNSMTSNNLWWQDGTAENAEYDNAKKQLDELTAQCNQETVINNLLAVWYASKKYVRPINATYNEAKKRIEQKKELQKQIDDIMKGL